MAESLVHRFIDALHRLEEGDSPDPLLELFTERATLSNVAVSDRRPADFWRSYRAQFRDIRSDFTQVIESGGLAALVWTARGTLRDGTACEYGGVTVLELEDDGIRALRSWYNPLALQAHLSAGSGVRAPSPAPSSSGASGESNEAPKDDPELEGPRLHPEGEGQATDASYAAPGREP